MSGVEEARAEAVAAVGRLRAELAELIAAGEGSVADDEHDPDSTTAFERAQVASLLRQAEERVAALDRAAASTSYGVCAGCGGPIGAERLAARPEADRCVRCAAASPRR